jgi:hypothetical protein
VTTRRRKIAAVVALLFAAVAVFAWLNWPSDETTRTSVDDAVASFRGEEGSGRGGGAGEPPLGVYRYATRGAESADTALLDGSHDFDGVSTIVLSHGRCGERERWQVLAERWTEAESCPAAHGDRLTAVREFHEFFEVEKDDIFKCRGGSVAAPPSERAGASFESSCRSADSSVSSISRVLGFGHVKVAGRTFAAVHTLTSSHIEGSSAGSFRREDWRRRSDGLLLRRSSQSVIDTDIAGGTHHTEAYTLRLLDPQPRS